VTQLAFGPINIVQGNSALFTVEFLDVNGNLTVPSSGIISVAYTNTSNAAQTDTVVLAQITSFFQGTWSSTSAALGIATWTLTLASSTQQTGSINITRP
jgi:hypothetical protein